MENAQTDLALAHKCLYAIVTNPVSSDLAKKGIAEDQIVSLLKVLMKSDTQYTYIDEEQTKILSKSFTPEIIKKLMPALKESIKNPYCGEYKQLCPGLKLWLQSPVSANYPDLLKEFNISKLHSYQIEELLRSPHLKNSREFLENIIHETSSVNWSYELILWKKFSEPDSIDLPDLLVDLIHQVRKNEKWPEKLQERIDDILRKPHWINYEPFRKACKGDPTYKCLIKKLPYEFKSGGTSIIHKINANCQSLYYRLVR
jgi:hypothetical protein